LTLDIRQKDKNQPFHRLRTVELIWVRRLPGSCCLYVNQGGTQVLDLLMNADHKPKARSTWPTSLGFYVTVENTYVRIICASHPVK